MNADLKKHIEALRKGTSPHWRETYLDRRAVEKIMIDAAAFLAAVSDPENQPNQYGLTHLTETDQR